MFPKFWPNFQTFCLLFQGKKKGLILEKFCYSARETLKILKKNWWFFGIFLKNWPKMVKFSKLFAKIPWKHWKFWWKSTFRFSRKNRPIFKTFCQNNAKIMRNLEKKSLLPIYQGLPAFQRSKIRPFTKVSKHSRGWHPVPVPRICPGNQSISEAIQEL